MSYVVHYGGHSYPIAGDRARVRAVIGKIRSAFQSRTLVEVPTTTGTVTLFFSPGVPVAVEEISETPSGAAPSGL